MSFHLSAQNIGTSTGGSAVASASYRATEKLNDRTDGRTHDFTGKERAVYKEIVLPENSPEWAKDRETLWNRAQDAEKIKDGSRYKDGARFAKEYNIALPKDVPKEQNIETVRGWIKDNFTSRGLAADFVIHKGGRNAKDNIHAHVMVTTRRLDERGFSEKNRQINEKSFLKEIRTNAADRINQSLERNGREYRVDSRSYKDRGIEKVPTIHEGRGPGREARQEINREIKEKNMELSRTNREIGERTEEKRDWEKLQERQEALDEKRGITNRRAGADNRGTEDRSGQEREPTGPEPERDGGRSGFDEWLERVQGGHEQSPETNVERDQRDRDNRDRDRERDKERERGIER